MNKFKLSEIEIKNFRNFKYIKVKTENNNLVIGTNDVGKTNFLEAIRKIFDHKSRNSEVLESDFYKKNVDEAYSIRVTLEISRLSDKDDNSNKLLMILRNLRENETIFHICLTVKFNGETSLKWKTDNIQSEYEDVPSWGVNKTLIDKVFDVYYISPHVNIDEQFTYFKRKMLREVESSLDDNEKKVEIENLNKEVNNKIKELDTVEILKENLQENLKKFNVLYDVTVESKIAISGLHDNLEIFTKENDSLDIYPTAGDGRKKTLMYAMFLQEIDSNTSTIPIILLEEPENHLFISAQESLSKTIFEEFIFSNIFMTTHSPHLMYSLAEQGNVIKLLKEKNNLSSKSSVFFVPNELVNMKKKYQRELAQAMFAKKVFLVEGYSEKILFDYILDNVNVSVEEKTSLYILNIIGVDFTPYYKFLSEIGIKVYVRTDNDLKRNNDKTELSGLHRAMSLIGETEVLYENEIIVAKKSATKEQLKKRAVMSRKIFRKYKEKVNELAKKNIYLARVDFEYDLADVFYNKQKDKLSMIKYLQTAKWHNLLDGEYSSEIFSEDGIKKILSHKLFKCLQAFIFGGDE